MNIRLNHIAIQTNDFENSVNWYKDYFGCQENWYLDKFSELTKSRLPTISKLTELQVNQLRFHIFDLTGPHQSPSENALQYQHFCVEVDSLEELNEMKSRWVNLYESGKYSFKRDELPTEIVSDADGITVFYALDVDGLEFEVMLNPA